MKGKIDDVFWLKLLFVLDIFAAGWLKRALLDRDAEGFRRGEMLPAICEEIISRMKTKVGRDRARRYHEAWSFNFVLGRECDLESIKRFIEESNE